MKTKDKLMKVVISREGGRGMGFRRDNTRASILFYLFKILMKKIRYNVAHRHLLLYLFSSVYLKYFTIYKIIF